MDRVQSNAASTDLLKLLEVLLKLLVVLLKLLEVLLKS
jgi:hypothetical protein